MALIAALLVVIALVLALVDGWVPTRPSWLLDLAVILICVAVLIVMFAGGIPINIDS